MSLTHNIERPYYMYSSWKLQVIQWASIWWGISERHLESSTHKTVSQFNKILCWYIQVKTIAIICNHVAFRSTLYLRTFFPYIFSSYFRWGQMKMKFFKQKIECIRYLQRKFNKFSNMFSQGNHPMPKWNRSK